MKNKISFGELISFTEQDGELVFTGVVIGIQQELFEEEPHGYLVLLLNHDESYGWEDENAMNFIHNGKWGNDMECTLIPVKDFNEILNTYGYKSVSDCRFWWVDVEIILDPFINVVTQINQELNEI